MWQDGNGTIDADEFKALLGVEKVTLLPAQSICPLRPSACHYCLKTQSMTPHGGRAHTAALFAAACHAMQCVTKCCDPTCLHAEEQAKRNMKVSTKESSSELWLTDEGFVLLAHDDKNEAIVCVGE